MEITIYGAGAIGGLTGAFLAKAGQDVLLVDMVAEHVEAMNRQGLKVTGFSNFTVPVRACLPGELQGQLGLTFLAVKAMNTEDALEVLEPLVGPETVVVSFQNGMNEPKIAARIGADRTIGAFINFGADWQGPGHVEHGGQGAIYLGELDGRITDRLRRLQTLLSTMQTVHVTDNLFGYLWSKITWASALFAQAVTNETTSDVMGNKRYQRLMIALCGEGVAVAQATGIKIEAFDAYEPLKMRPRTDEEMAAAVAVLDRISERNKGRVKARSGIWRDLAVRHRSTEVDSQVGFLISEGEKLGIDTPLLKRLMTQIKEIERGERQQGLDNLEELLV